MTEKTAPSSTSSQTPEATASASEGLAPRAHLDALLRRAIALGASDLHVSGDEVPFLRVHGRLGPMPETDRVEARRADLLARSIMNERQEAVFEAEQTLDLSLSAYETRFRINVFRERGRTALSIRRLEEEFRGLADWNLPRTIGDLAELRDGLVIVTGPTGSGKTTTLSTLVHQINLDRACHIITIEDPVEYIHANHRSLIRQRELHTDVPDFASAVRAALREDPDVILVGEMRDAETIRAAITAAETGHLVFSTLHTGDAVGAIDRVTGAFTGGEREAVRNQLAMVLRAVIAQRLLIGAKGESRVPAVEVLRVSKAVANLIRTDRPQQIYSLMETGGQQGMQTFEQALAELVARGLAHEDDARRLARDPIAFDERVRLAQGGSRRGAR